MKRNYDFEMEFAPERWLRARRSKNGKAAYFFSPGLERHHYTMVAEDGRLKAHWTDETKEQGSPERKSDIFGVSLASFTSWGTSKECQQEFFELLASAQVRNPRHLRQKRVDWLVTVPEVTPQTNKLGLAYLRNHLQWQRSQAAWIKPPGWFALAADKGRRSLGGVYRLSDALGQPVVVFFEWNTMLKVVELMFRYSDDPIILAGFRESLTEAD